MSSRGVTMPVLMVLQPHVTSEGDAPERSEQIQVTGGTQGLPKRHWSHTTCMYRLRSHIDHRR